jgi:choline dehydrogenase-like flavoprotein
MTFTTRATTAAAASTSATVPPLLSALNMPPEGLQWAPRSADALHTRISHCWGHTSQLPVATNAVDLDPEAKDKGLPAIRVTYNEHGGPADVQAHVRSRPELLQAATPRTWGSPPGDDPGLGVHLLGTCRMGNDPRTSVVNASHRAHDVPNLFMVDGGSFVTSGRGQPTLTIQALAFRAADHASRMAKRGELG